MYEEVTLLYYGIFYKFDVHLWLVYMGYDEDGGGGTGWYVSGIGMHNFPGGGRSLTG